MRLLIALPDNEAMRWIHQELDRLIDCDFTFSSNGEEVLRLIQYDYYDVLLLHACLCGLDGLTLGNAISSMRLLCPPRILLLTPYDYHAEKNQWADCIAVCGVSIQRLCKLIELLMQKPLPNMAAANDPIIYHAVVHFLDELHLNTELKGRMYASWMLLRLICSPVIESKPLNTLYTSCAAAFQTTPSAVERCLRIAVESIFTMGSLKSIEHYFGSSFDPEKGKLTNRAFLLRSARYLRQNLTP